MKLILLFLFTVIVINSYGQSTLLLKDSVLYDTIPARFQIYEDHCERCPILIETGYVVYQNTARYEKVRMHYPMDNKDSLETIFMFLSEPERVQVNPYLRKNKLLMWMNVTVWDYKLDRGCVLKPLKGL